MFDGSLDLVFILQHEGVVDVSGAPFDAKRVSATGEGDRFELSQDLQHDRPVGCGQGPSRSEQVTGRDAGSGVRTTVAVGVNVGDAQAAITDEKMNKIRVVIFPREDSILRSSVILKAIERRDPLEHGPERRLEAVVGPDSLHVP
jgi:hypothetical protein